MFKLILIDSGLKLLLYGTRIRINSSPGNIWKFDFNIFSYPGNIGNRVFLIAWYPGNIGNLIFSTSSYPGNIGSYDPYSVLSWKYWKLKSSTFSIILEILEIWFFWFSPILEILENGFSRSSHILEILEICFFFYILGFLQKRRAPKFHAEWSGFRGEISHMRPIQGRKLKLFQTPISKWLGEIHLHAAARLHEDMLSLLHAAAWLHEDMFSFLFNILNTVSIAWETDFSDICLLNACLILW